MIQSSLAIEGNTLSLEQVTDIIEGIPVIGPPKDLLEAQNAIKVYDDFNAFKFASEDSFKKAHKIMMKTLIQDAGNYRSTNVGVFAGSNIAHVAPQPKMVPKLMKDLFAFLGRKDDVSLLIKACVFHYELEFIHPFKGGNGRMGRLWQQLILSSYHEIFQYVAIAATIKEKKKEYYEVLAQCDRNGDSTFFVEFSLELIKNALQGYLNQITYEPKTPLERLQFAKEMLSDKFTRKDYIAVFRTVSSATASRDLSLGVKRSLLNKSGDKNNTRYVFL